MFKLITLQDTIRIPPETFGKPLEKVGREQVKQKYEGIVDEELGYVIAVTGIQVSPIGKIIPGDGATFHKVTFSLLAFYPIIQEVVEGDVVEIADFGALSASDQSTHCYTFHNLWTTTYPRRRTRRPFGKRKQT